MSWILIITALLATTSSAAPPSGRDGQKIPPAPELSPAAAPRTGLATPRADGGSPVTLRFLLPNSPESPSQDGALTRVVEEFNRQNAAAVQVTLVRRGENYSSLKELVAAYLAGDTPDLAVIESSEYPALEKMKLACPIRLKGSTPKMAIPFRVTVPILLADQEILFRLHVDPEELPTTWRELGRLVERISRNISPEGAGKDRHALALPLQGPRGLWLFEALAGKPLWKREPGGIRANRELAGPIELLRKTIDQPLQLSGDETWERALQSFLERKSPLLITSLDALPAIVRQATFRWTAGPVPSLSHGLAEMDGGSQLVLTRDSPEAQRFIQFLMTPENTARWLAPEGYLPPRPEWLKSAAWKSLGPAPGRSSPVTVTALALATKIRPKSQRTTDSEVVRIHSEWVRALRLLFSESAQRLPLESVFTQLDSQLSAKEWH